MVNNDSGGVESGPTACGDEQVTINKVATHIATTPSGADGAAVGTGLTDTATLTGGFNPTGTVTFLLYGPGNTGCANGDNSSHAWLQRWVVPLSGDGTASVPAPGMTTSMTGTYTWVANYSGDSNNMPAHDSCGAESVAVGKATPKIATTASNAGPIGTRIHDTAQVTGGDNPTGTVTFNLFPPSNPTCSSSEGSTGSVQTVTVALGANGSATTAATPYTTTEIGTYNWIARYNGDANNNSATTKCGDEQVTIGKDGTSIVTKASAGGIPGTAIHDTATVTGTIMPTGTVTFSLYGPADTSCKAAPIFTSIEHVDASGRPSRHPSARPRQRAPTTGSPPTAVTQTARLRTASAARSWWSSRSPAVSRASRPQAPERPMDLHKLEWALSSCSAELRFCWAVS